MTAHTVYRTFTTTQRREFVRITGDVQAAVDESGIADGMVLVLGLGRVGIACARRLQELGMDVLGVDADLDLVNRYADTLRHVVRMDSTDADALR